jgi:tRNA threonylcarbamoyladenosine biosynthesis protein TsaB
LTVLAFDTATAACSAAVWRDGAILARRFEMMARGQSEALMPMIVATLRDAGLGWGELSLIAVTVGPGAFTGLRIGLAAARGLALSTGLPVAGVLTTEALAAAVPPAERVGRTVLAVIDAKRADVFVQAFDPDLAPRGEVQAMLPEEVPGLAGGPLLVVGDGAERVLPFLPGARRSAARAVPDAAVLAPLAEARWQAGTALPPRPVYIRPPDVTLPGPKA